MPAVIDYVQKTTNHCMFIFMMVLIAFIFYLILFDNTAKIAYIGHSQGTAVMFALLSDPLLSVKYNDLIEPFIAVSPITRIGNATTVYRYFVKALHDSSSQ